MQDRDSARAESETISAVHRAVFRDNAILEVRVVASDLRSKIVPLDRLGSLSGRSRPHRRYQEGCG